MAPTHITTGSGALACQGSDGHNLRNQLISSHMAPLIAMPVPEVPLLELGRCPPEHQTLCKHTAYV